jgi:hypothetical protein
MEPQQVRWGNTILLLDSEELRQGYEQGRMYYFDEFGESGIEPSPDPADWVRGEDVASTILFRRHNDGAWRLDPDVSRSPLTLVGVLVGYLSAPLHPETRQEQDARLCDVIVFEDRLPL